MNSRERIRAIVSGHAAHRCGFWMGNPDPDTWPIYHEYFGTSSERELRARLGDDLAWIFPESFRSTYRHPTGKGLLDFHWGKASHGAPGPFADCQDPAAEYDCLPSLEDRAGIGDD